jgi:hypothetical protein
VGDPNKTDAGDVVGSRVAAVVVVVAVGGRAAARDAGDAGIATIGEEAVDNRPMEEEVLAEEVLEVDSSWRNRVWCYYSGEQTRMDADVMAEMGYFFSGSAQNVFRRAG